MQSRYLDTRARLEGYFDRSAAAAWEQLTSEGRVSRIRQTVRAGRDRMRQTLLGSLPLDLSGLRVLDAGCGTGQMARDLAERGAEVTAIDLSPRLLEVAAARTSSRLAERIDYRAGDMLDHMFGSFDHVVAMDSLIHYRPDDAARALADLAGRSRRSVVFTIAPRTTLLAAMHLVGKLVPRGDHSPAIVPVREVHLHRELSPLCRWSLRTGQRITSGFYISKAMELRP